MAIKDSNTEQQIIQTAKQLFFKEGRFRATTQEIADAAGVNRTLVHYYFRSKDVLFNKVLEDARNTVITQMETIMQTSTSFRDKINHFIDVMIDQSLNYPYLDIYIVTRMNSENKEQGDTILDDFQKKRSYQRFKQFLQEIQNEMDKGTIPKSTPTHFFLNLMSMLVYPAVAQPMFRKLFNLSEKQYRQLLTDRKEVILKTLFS